LFRAMIPSDTSTHCLTSFLNVPSTTCQWRTGPGTFRPGPPCRPGTPAGPPPCRPGQWTPAGPARLAWLALCDLVPEAWVTSDRPEKVHALYTPGNQEGWGRCCCVPGVPRAYCSSNYPLSLEIYV
jgi:hypothetical protein